MSALEVDGFVNGNGRAVSKPARVILIGLDSADRQLIERWCDSGDLPVLAALRARGVSGHLSSPPGLADDAAWASFSTSLSPGRHGRFFWKHFDPGSYELRLWRESVVNVKPFWAVLSDAGRRVAVVDVPKCPLTPGLNGVQLSDWLVHGRDYPETCSWPPELAHAVRQRFGDDRTDRPDQDWLCWLHALPETRLPGFLAHLHDGLRRKIRFASELLQQEHWDLFLVVFKEAHCVGHQCWHLLDAEAQDPVKAIYRALDQAVGELIRHGGAETSVIVFSDLGMRPNNTGEHLLDAVLRRLERTLITPRQRVRRALRQWRQRRAALLGRPDAPVHANSDRLAYRVDHNEISGAVRINLAGREPDGLVRRGDEQDRLCRLLRQELLALHDPATGRRLVNSVLLTREAFPGDQQERLPDLLAVWNGEDTLTGAASASVGEIRLPPPGFRTGNHVEGGFFIGAGPAVVPGRTVDASLLDLAPTVARMLGTSLPHREGRPIPEMCGRLDARAGVM